MSARPTYQVIYEGVNITDDISERLLSLTYTDKVQGEIDEVQITLDNSDEVWLNDWLPEIGDLIDVSIGYEGAQLDCGTFAVDEISASSPPDTVTLKALAASRKSTLRTKVSRAYEKLSLRDIAQQVATRQGLELVDQYVTERTTVSYDNERQELSQSAAILRDQFTRLQSPIINFSTANAFTRIVNASTSLIRKGKRSQGQRILDDIEVLRTTPVGNTTQIRAAASAVAAFLNLVERTAANLQDDTFERSVSRLAAVRIARATQNRESDMAFLNRTSRKYGYYFSVRGEQLVFIYFRDLHDAPPVRTLTRRDIASWSISRKASDTYKSVRARHQNPDTGELVEFSADYEGGEDVSDDTLELHGRYESEQQAREAADAELTERNTAAIEGSISKEGDIGLISGANIELPDIGRYSGIFTITESTHSIDRSGGYATSASIKRVRR